MPGSLQRASLGAAHTTRKQICGKLCDWKPVPWPGGKGSCVFSKFGSGKYYYSSSFSFIIFPIWGYTIRHLHFETNSCGGLRMSILEMKSPVHWLGGSLQEWEVVLEIDHPPTKSDRVLQLHAGFALQLTGTVGRVLMSMHFLKNLRWHQSRLEGTLLLKLRLSELGLLVLRNASCEAIDSFAVFQIVAVNLAIWINIMEFLWHSNFNQEVREKVEGKWLRLDG